MIYQPSYQRRLDWALKHLERLEAEERRWQEERPCRVWTEFDLESGYNLIWAEVLKPPPAPVGLIIGDCLHNLRSSLDNLAYELALAHKKGRLSKSIAKDSGFPILQRDDADSLKKFKCMTRGIHPEGQALIKELQPYNRGNKKSILLILRQFHDTDKQRLPHVTVAPTPDTLTFFATNFRGLSDVEIFWGPIEGRAVIGRYLPSGEHYAEMDMQRPATFRIAFGEGAPDVTQGIFVVPTMRQMHEFIAFDIAPDLIRYLA